jgi:predicted nucleic acid-binding protein
MADCCYLDTTVLIEALFKTSRRRRKARAAVQDFAKSLLPVYAIKEMSAGALSYAVWLYNKLSETHSVQRTHDAIVSNIKNPNRVTTSLELLGAASEAFTGADLADARTPAQLDRMLAEMNALSLRRIILNGWRSRRKITTDVVQELDCFPENAPYIDEELHIMTVGKSSCPSNMDCHYASELRRRPSDLNLLLQVLKGSTRREDIRRRKALNVLARTPKRSFDNGNCRGLGDAYFALNCPKNATILTSNQRDHAPLAEALGKSVTPYKWKEE